MIFLSISFISLVRGVGFAANDAVNLVIDFTRLRFVTSGVPRRVEKVTQLEVTWGAVFRMAKRLQRVG